MDKSWVRQPAVAGRFYPGSESTLKEMLQSLLKEKQSELEVPGIMAPHAGYIYSGRYAADVYRKVKIPDTVILVCPNHTGSGKRISVWSEGSWETPLGECLVDRELAADILQNCGEPKGDREAHIREHANEVHVPFVQTLNPHARIVPITLGPMTLDRCIAFGNALAESIQARPFGNVLLVASTDMSHFLSADESRGKDQLALKAVERLNPGELYQTVIAHEISMCGFIPTTAALRACQALGSQKASLVSYGHSGEVTQDLSSVVGYASAVLA